MRNANISHGRTSVYFYDDSMAPARRWAELKPNNEQPLHRSVWVFRADRSCRLSKMLSRNTAIDNVHETIGQCEETKSFNLGRSRILVHCSTVFRKCLPREICSTSSR